MSFAEDHGPSCGSCSGPSTRAVRTRKIVLLTEPVYYLTYFWSCSVCGHGWVDEGLEHLNASAEQSARALARRAS